MTDPMYPATIGPNSNVGATLIARDVVLVVGEHAPDVAEAFAWLVEDARVDAEHRCYRFWRAQDTSLIWTGIGTGCLEPLLGEILPLGRIDRIVLVGTAGILPGQDAALGRAYAISRAHSAGTALDAAIAETGLVPTLQIDGVEERAALSTDLYYLFSTRELPRECAAQALHLQDRYDSARARSALIDMETAQFFALCRWLGSENLRYGAVRAPANRMEHPREQSQWTAQALHDCARVVRRALEHRDAGGHAA